MKKVNGSTLLKYIRETEFRGITEEDIYFNANGDPPGRYEFFLLSIVFFYP
jgi:hypothetical protein